MALNDYLQGIDRYTAGPKADVSNAAKDLSNLQAGQGSLPTKLKEALSTKLNNNKDIINQQADTMQNYFNSGSNARAKYADVFNPFEKAKLVEQDKTAALRPYDVLSGILSDRMGSVNDIVQSGIQGWQGMVNSATTKAELAKSMLANALSQYGIGVGQQTNADNMSLEAAKAKEQSRQFGLNYGLEQTKVGNQASQFDRDLAARLGIANMKSGGGSSGGGSGPGGAYTAADISGLAQYLYDSGSDPQAVAALTNDKNANAVTSQINSLKGQAAKEKADADARNKALIETQKKNDPINRAVNGATSWLSNYFANNTYSPTIYGGVFTPNKK